MREEDREPQRISPHCVFLVTEDCEKYVLEKPRRKRGWHYPLKVLALPFVIVLSLIMVAGLLACDCCIWAMGGRPERRR